MHYNIKIFFQTEHTFYFFFKFLSRRCLQKKYIVLGTTALSMLLALTTAIILTINVFHVTTTRHLRGHDHYHGDRLKNADSAEMYQKASIASDSGLCSSIGMFNLFVFSFLFNPLCAEC